ncbi:MAG: NAD(P)-dependent oxidoreductase [Nitrospinota bacterium]|jgi:3-hydroxyisobutyrate dehydrogenase-like beta-hydroxyacid dehydrogenase|nr:NAD(P)-dependent oxidoreductase [Nitrospinota bacterium]
MANRARNKPIIGFIGLGLMGRAFSKNLIADGHRVFGCDPDRAARAKFKRLGGEPAASPREVAEEADIVMISVPNSKISIQASRGKEGFLAFAKEKAPALICDTTTADPEDSRRLAVMCKKKGVDYLDACVSGHSENVKNRVGLLIAGGPERAYKKVSPIFGKLLDDQIYCGPSGSGATMKVLINYLTCLQRCAIAETIRMGLRSGVKGGVLFKALHRSAADSRQLRNRGQRMIKRRYTNPVSAVTVLHKDINLGMTLAKRSKSITPIGSASLPFYDEALSSGYGELDSAVVYKVFEDREKKKKRSR